jgi:hypothetical protein
MIVGITKSMRKIYFTVITRFMTVLMYGRIGYKCQND